MAVVTGVPQTSPAVAGSDAVWTPLYRAGGICALLAAAAYLGAIGLTFSVPAAPTTGGAETLAYIAEHRTVYILEQVLWLGPSALLLVTMLALYPLLRGLHPSYTAIGVLLSIVSWAAGLAVPAYGGGAPGLVYLSDQYSTAASGAERAQAIAAAEAFIAQNNTAIAVGVLQTIGILLVSLVMLRGVVRTWVAWLGVATGAVGIASEALRPVLGIGYILYGSLVIVWIIAIGWELLRTSGTGTPQPAREALT